MKKILGYAAVIVVSAVSAIVLDRKGVIDEGAEVTKKYSNQACSWTKDKLNKLFSRKAKEVESSEENSAE